jgi:signal transduction histidine kinase
MSAPKRLRTALIGLTTLGVGLLLAALWIDDAQFLGRDRMLGESLQQAQAAAREADLVHTLQQFLAPQAVLIDGRRGEILDALSRAADSPAVSAWATRQPGALPPRTILETLGRDRTMGWSSAVLTGKFGWVAAAWPIPVTAGPGTDLSKDPYFLALSDPDMGPGIVRHGYAKTLPAKGPASDDLVAACGIADAQGNFAGLLEIHADASRIVFGPDSTAFRPMLSAYPGSVVLLVLGDGREVYNSAQAPLTENLAAAGQAGLLRAALAAPTGSLDVEGYAGGPSLAVWQRVGSVAQGSTPADVLSLILFVPSGAFAAPGAGPQEAPQAFYQKPQVLAPLALALVLLLLALGLLLRAAPQDITGEILLLTQASPDGPGRDDASPAPGNAPAAAPQPEVRVAEEPGVQATPAPAVDDAALKGLRDELSAAQAALRDAERKLGTESKAGLEIKTQLGELRSALEASKRDADLAAAESRAREAKAQDAARGLEGKLKVAEKSGGLHREQEAVRLAAVNTLSGELKATLEVIKNYISTLLGGQGAINDSQQEFLGIVINKSARLERLIGDLVEISEIGSGMKPMRLESVGSDALVQDALVNVRPQAENKNISLDLVESGALSHVKVDREKMGVVLRGLLSQAVKVSPRNEKIGLQLSEKDSSVELRVTDSGMNLSPERAAKVFVQFHGVDSPAGPEFIGTGLRFTIFRSVVEAHGGTISIESQAGRGKTYVLTLPKDPDAPPETGSPAAPAAAAPKPMPPVPAAAGPSSLPPLGPPPLGPAPLGPPPLGPAPLGPPPLGPPPLAPASAGLPPLGPAPLGPPPLGPPPLAPASAGLPPLGPAPLGPPPASKPLAAPSAAGLPPLPPSAPPAAPVAPAPAAPAPVIYKPAPVDETLNAPWKRKEASDGVDLDEWAELPISPAAGPPSGGQAGKIDAGDFEKIFGAPSAGARPEEAPKTESKAGAKPNDTDLVQFSAVFGASHTPPPPPAPLAPPAAPAAPVAAARPASPAPPPAPMGAGALGSDFDALFGPPTGASAPKAPPPPPPVAKPAAQAPPPPPPAALKPAPPPLGLNTLDDLNELLGQ